MLGRIGSARDWWWAAAGKHPAAKDFLRLGHRSPFADGFADWMEKGYRILGRKENKPVSDFRFWRFWTRGFGRDALACGIVRDSSDRIGRQYPFLVVGNGPLRGWEGRWDLLTLACEKTWNRMEDLSLSVQEDVGRLLEDIPGGMSAPIPAWDEHAGRRDDMVDGGESTREKSFSIEGDWPGHSRKTEFLVDLNRGREGDAPALAALWTRFLKTRFEAAPNTIFFGGTPRRTYLAVFRRPLVPNDFVSLWSVSGSEEPAGATIAPSA